MDLQHSDFVFIMGSNMAECHPVAFRWVMKAKTRLENPCTLIHADPRFTRTSAMANIYCPLRAGSDIVLLGALIHYVLERLDALLATPQTEEGPRQRQRFFHDYLVHYTNAATLINQEFSDTEEGEGGIYAGFQQNPPRYDFSKWRYDTEPPGRHLQPNPARQSFAEMVGRMVGGRPRQDETLQNPRCVYQILK